MDFLWRGQAIYMVECLRISDMLSKHITVIWPVLQPASQSDPFNTFSKAALTMLSNKQFVLCFNDEFYLTNKSFKFDFIQRFCEIVRRYFISRVIFQLHFIFFDYFSNEMLLYIDMLRSTVKFEISKECYSILIVRFYCD